MNAIGIKRLLSSRFFIHTLKIFNVNTFFLDEEKIDEYFSILAVFHLVILDLHVLTLCGAGANDSMLSCLGRLLLRQFLLAV